MVSMCCNVCGTFLRITASMHPPALPRPSARLPAPGVEEDVADWSLADLCDRLLLAVCADPPEAEGHTDGPAPMPEHHRHCWLEEPAQSPDSHALFSHPRASNNLRAPPHRENSTFRNHGFMIYFVRRCRPPGKPHCFVTLVGAGQGGAVNKWPTDFCSRTGGNDMYWLLPPPTAPPPFDYRKGCLGGKTGLVTPPHSFLSVGANQTTAADRALSQTLKVRAGSAAFPSAQDAAHAPPLLSRGGGGKIEILRARGREEISPPIS